MNRHYSFADARSWLSSYIALSSQQESTLPYLGTFELEGSMVQEFKDPRCLRMVGSASEDLRDDVDEVVLRIPGVLCSKTLPQVASTISAERDDEIRMLRQFVKITGVGCDGFGDLQGKIEQVFQRFQSALRGASLKLLEWNPYDGQYAVDAHTRYFTERRHAPSLSHQPFPPEIDPYEVLEEFCGTKYIRTDDNIVQYLRRIQTEDGLAKYVRISPSVFKEGDMVEVWAAFVAYPAGPGKYKLVLAIRSLVLLTDQFRQAADDRWEEARRVQAQVQAISRADRRQTLPTSGSLKRKYMENIEDDVTMRAPSRKK